MHSLSPSITTNYRLFLLILIVCFTIKSSCCQIFILLFYDFYEFCCYFKNVRLFLLKKYLIIITFRCRSTFSFEKNNSKVCFSLIHFHIRSSDPKSIFLSHYVLERQIWTFLEHFKAFPIIPAPCHFQIKNLPAIRLTGKADNELMVIIYFAEIQSKE